MPAWTSDKKDVCPSVCQMRALWQNGRKICPDFYTIRWYERSFSLVFWEKEWLAGAWNFGSTGPLLSEIADFESIFARSASAITPTKKVQLTLIGSPLSAFQCAYRWSSYVAPMLPPPKKKWAQKCKTAVFGVKIALRLKKDCYKVSLCENVRLFF